MGGGLQKSLLCNGYTGGGYSNQVANLTKRITAMDEKEETAVVITHVQGTGGVLWIRREVSCE